MSKADWPGARVGRMGSPALRSEQTEAGGRSPGFTHVSLAGVQQCASSVVPVTPRSALPRPCSPETWVRAALRPGPPAHCPPEPLLLSISLPGSPGPHPTRVPAGLCLGQPAVHHKLAFPCAGSLTLGDKRLGENTVFA